jgi:hypothetical protein
VPQIGFCVLVFVDRRVDERLFAGIWGARSVAGLASVVTGA